ncbi:hypothetical protein JCM5353_003566 [Sporobolomyces roseus]
MSKTVDAPQACTVCDNQTTLACSKCQTTFFCSTECQRPLWATHQFTCGKPESSFIVPPLSAIEVGILCAIGRDLVIDEEAPGVVADKTLFEIIVDLGLFEGTWDELASELLGKGRRLKEPFLSPCLLLARGFAHNAIHLSFDGDNSWLPQGPSGSLDVRKPFRTDTSLSTSRASIIESPRI